MTAHSVFDDHHHDCGGGGSLLVNRLLGRDSYQIVRLVALNLEHITSIRNQLDALVAVGENIEAVTAISLKLTVLQSLFDNMVEILNVEENIQAVAAAGTHIVAINALYAQIDKLLTLHASLGDLVTVTEAINNAEEALAARTNFRGSRALAIATVLPGAMTYLLTAGMNTIGDGGRALYKKISTPGAPDASHFQSADGAWWKIAETIYDVKMFGAVGDGVVYDDVAINSAIQMAKLNGCGSVRLSGGPGTVYLINRSLDVSGMSNIRIFADHGVILRCTAQLDGTDNSTRNDMIYALNFSGSTGPNGYPYKNIIIEDIIFDASLMSGSGIDNDADNDGIVDWREGINNFGRTLGGVEIMNVDYATIRRCTFIRCFGNGAVIATQDPRLKNNAGQPNGVRNPIIEDNVFIECTRGLLPQYGSDESPYGTTGTVIQIGSCHGGRIANNVFLRSGGPATDTFNCDGLYIVDNYIEGVAGTPIGASPNNAINHHQNVQVIRSDFGLTNSYICRNTFIGAGGIRLNGSMTNEFFFNGYLRTPGPISCVIEDNKLINPMGFLQITAPTIGASGAVYESLTTIPIMIYISGGASVTVSVKRGVDGTFVSRPLGPQGAVLIQTGDSIQVNYVTTPPTWVWFEAPNGDSAGIVITGGSVPGFPGQAAGNTIRNNRIVNPGSVGMLFYDASHNIIEGNYIENPGATGGGVAFDFYAQVNQAGSGCLHNKIKNNFIVESRSPSALVNVYREDNSGKCQFNEYGGNDLTGSLIGAEAVISSPATSICSVPVNYTAAVSSLVSGGTPAVYALLQSSWFDTPGSKVRKVTGKFSVTSIGTATVGCIFELPSAPVGEYLMFRGREMNTGKALQGVIAGNYVLIQLTDGTFPVVNGSIVSFTLEYQAR